MDNKEAMKKRWAQYWTHPEYWVNDFFGDRLQLNNQQHEACVELGKLIDAKLKFVRGEKLTEAEALLAKKIGVSIMAGKGCGKDMFAAILICYFLTVFESPHVMGTANTGAQLKNVLWREISKVMSLSKPKDPDNPSGPTILQDVLVWQTEKVYYKEAQGQRWFAEARTISPHATTDEQAKSLTGRHEEVMFFVIDEAAGVPEPALNALEETLTGKLNLILMIFNPIKTSCFAVQSHQKNRSKWVALHWDTEKTVFKDEGMNRSMQARNKRIEDERGRDSNPFRVSVLGLPPLADSDALISYDWVMDAVDREIVPDIDEPVIMGVDPAAGGDKSVIVIRKGGKILEFITFNLSDTMQFVGRVVQAIGRYEPTAIMIDPIGVGKGVADRLIEQGYRVFEVDVRRTAYNSRFYRLRDELWWNLRKQFERGIISIPNNQDLIDQITAVKSAEPDSMGKERVISKKDMKKSIDGSSPDEADALCLTYVYGDEMFRQKVYDDEDEKKEKRRDLKRNPKTGY